MPLFTGPDVQRTTLDLLTVGLSQVLFPVVLLLGLNGLLVGILQSYDHFTIPAISPAVWNVVIIVLLVVLHPHFHGGYENGEAAVRATRSRSSSRRSCSCVMAFGALGRIDFRLQFTIDWRDPRIRQVFTLMLPVTIGLGHRQPRPADQLGVRHARVTRKRRARSTTPSASTCCPQGLFSVAVATVLFPTLSRMAASARRRARCAARSGSACARSTCC